MGEHPRYGVHESRTSLAILFLASRFWRDFEINLERPGDNDGHVVSVKWTKVSRIGTRSRHQTPDRQRKRCMAHNKV